jgi:hypothetical protein
VSVVVLLAFEADLLSVVGAVAVVDSVLYLSLNEVGVSERDTVAGFGFLFGSLLLLPLEEGRLLPLYTEEPPEPLEPLPTTFLWP